MFVTQLVGKVSQHTRTRLSHAVLHSAVSFTEGEQASLHNMGASV